MAIFLDSADPDDARSARNLGFVAGITTNPTLMAKTMARAGRPDFEILAELLPLTAGPVFYQVTAATPEKRDEQARAATVLAPGRVVVKIPATTENFTLAAALAEDNIRCAITAVSRPIQAYLAAQVGADYAIPYVSRLTRNGGDGISVLRESAAAVAGTRTRMLAASLKTVDEVEAALLSGADVVTIPLPLIEDLGDHELSQQAIREFAESYGK